MELFTKVLNWFIKFFISSHTQLDFLKQFKLYFCAFDWLPCHVTDELKITPDKQPTVNNYRYNNKTWRLYWE